MSSLPKSNSLLRIAAAGELWWGELEEHWPKAFGDALASIAAQQGWGTVFQSPLDVVAQGLGFITDSYAGNDPLDFLGGPGSVEFIRRVDGVFFMLALPKPRRVYVPRLLNCFKAAGREPASVPLVVVVSKAAPPSPPRASLLTDQFSAWPSSAVVDVDCETGEGIAQACERMLELIARARAAPAISRERPPLPPPARGAALGVPPPRLDVRAVHEILNRGDHAAALELLLDAWRACRAPALACAVEALCYRARSLRPELIDHPWWLQTCRARRAVDLAVLLDSFTLPVSARPHERTAHTVARLEALLDWPDDPRLTPRIAAMLADMGRLRPTAVWKALVQLLAHHGDPRAAAVLRRLVDDLDHHVRPPNELRDPEIREAAVAAIAALDAKFRDGLPARLDVPLSEAPARTGLLERTAGLAPSVVDANDARRLDLAARLVAAGDPRGELIELQSTAAQRALSPAESCRERQLVRSFAWEWLGGLVEVAELESAVFSRGVLTGVTLRADNQRAIAEVVGRPEWATVEAIDWGAGAPVDGEDAVDEALFLHPVMKSVRRLSGVSLRGLTSFAMLRAPCAIEEARLGWSESESAVEEAIAAGASLPSLKRLEIRARQPEEVSWVWRTSLVPNLETLEARWGSAWECARDLQDWWRPLEEARPQLTHLLLRRGHGISLCLEREGGEARFSRVSAWQDGLVERHPLSQDDIIVCFRWGGHGLLPLSAVTSERGARCELREWRSLPELVLEPAFPGAARSEARVTAVAVDPKHRWAAFADEKGVVSIDDASRLETVHELDALASSEVHALAFDTAGERLFAFSRDERLAVWSVPSFTLERIVALDPSPPGSKGFYRVLSPDGRLCALFGHLEKSCVIAVHATDGRRVRLSAPLPEGFARGLLAFSPDGRWLAIGGDDGSTPPAPEARAVLLWDLAEQEQPEIVARVHDRVRSLAFSPDGAHLMWIDDHGCYTLSMTPDPWRAKLRLGIWSFPRWFEPGAYGLPPDGKLADVDPATTCRTPEARAGFRYRDCDDASGVALLPDGAAALGSAVRWARWRLLP